MPSQLGRRVVSVRICRGERRTLGGHPAHAPKPPAGRKNDGWQGACVVTTLRLGRGPTNCKIARGELEGRRRAWDSEPARCRPGGHQAMLTTGQGSTQSAAAAVRCNRFRPPRAQATSAPFSKSTHRDCRDNRQREDPPVGAPDQGDHRDDEKDDWKRISENSPASTVKQRCRCRRGYGAKLRIRHSLPVINRAVNYPPVLEPQLVPAHNRCCHIETGQRQQHLRTRRPAPQGPPARRPTSSDSNFRPCSS